MSDQRWPKAILEREWLALRWYMQGLLGLRALEQHKTNRLQLSRPDEQNDIGPTSVVNVNKLPTLAQGMIAIWICFLCILCFTANCHVLQTVYCLMPNANCLLLTAKCPLPTVYCHMPMYCQLSTAKNKLPNAHCCCCLLLCSHLCNREDTSSHHK